LGFSLGIIYAVGSLSDLEPAEYNGGLFVTIFIITIIGTVICAIISAAFANYLEKGKTSQAADTDDTDLNET
jgi:hypothetical protein